MFGEVIQADIESGKATLDAIDLADKRWRQFARGVNRKKSRAAKVTGIDIDSYLIRCCDELAQTQGVSDKLAFLKVDPGPLMFPDQSFDTVTSKDSIIHIPDKQALANDVFRILKPGGWFVASDWLAGYDDQPSAEMQAYLTAEGLDFGLAPAERYQAALEGAGFVDIQLVEG